MTLAPGTRLGVYEVTELIGHGGMGAVYRAHDTRLGRDVAIKVLPDAFRADPDRVARFEREARALASLNHPHIGAIYGLEETPGRADTTVTALVLELVDGPSLADRIVAGPLPLPEALRVAREIADALEAAHERGVVHRDLKPANIKLTSEGSAKVLDFGLAKLVGAHDSDLTPSQTMSETLAGAILGTPRYMSPEQARGQAIDKRTDIWSFGCVLYEMLTGHFPFPGETPSDTIGAILNHQPDWRVLPETMPAQVRTLLRRCLEKDPRQRLRDIGDARIELDTVITQRTSSPPEKASAEEGGRAARRHAWMRALVLTSALVALIAVTVAVATWIRTSSAPPASAVHMTALLPTGVSVTRGPGMVLSLALSPDGKTLVIAGTDANGQRLYQRTLDRADATPLEGTEGALSPFFSPDGQWIGFFADRHLKRVPARGGTAIDITAAPGYPGGASWGIDDRIVFASGHLSPLRVVPANGGRAENLTTPDGGQGHRFPDFLPNGRVVLFSDGNQISALEMASRRRIDLGPGTAPRYATPPFRLTLDGGRAPVWTPDGESITYSVPVPNEQAGLYTRSADGRGSARQLLPLTRFHWLVGWTPQQVLAYGTMDEPVDGVSRSSILAVQGTGSRYVVGPGDTWGGRLSPDGRRLVYYTLDSGYFEIYVTEFPDTGARWLIAEGTDPAWSPDGSEIYYRSGSRLMTARIDTASGVRVLSRRVAFEPFIPPLYDDYAIHPNGRTLAVVRPVGDARGREVAWVLNWREELQRLTQP
jgi:hypothetical protein